MMVSKGTKFLAHMYTFNKDIREWRRQTTNLKTWTTFKIFFHQAHREQRRAVTTTGKEGYTAAVQNIYGARPTPPEEHQKAIENLNTIFQWMQTQGYNIEGPEQ